MSQIESTSKSRLERMAAYGRRLSGLCTGPRSIAALGLLVLLHWCATGITIIREDEQGVVTRFGAVTRVAPAGILFTLPWPLERVISLKTTEVRTMPVGYKMVDAVRGIAPRPREVEWITGDKNIINLSLTIKYSINDPVRYLYRVGPREADFLVRRCAEANLTTLIATITVDEVLTSGKIQLQEDTRRSTQEMLDQLEAGIRLVSVNISSVEPPANVIDAFNDVATAKSDKAKVLNQADGYQRDLIPRARAKADRFKQDALRYRTEVLTQAQNDSTRFCNLLAEVDKAREITETRLYLETIGKILAEARTLVVDTKSGDKIHLR